GDVGIDTVGVPLQDLTVLVGHGGQLLTGQVGEAEGAEELVGLDLALAEHLREAARADVPPEVHLPEPLLGVDEPLGEEEVVVGGGHDVRDAPAVAMDRHRLVQAVHPDLPVHLGKRSPDGPQHEARPGDDEHQQHHQDSSKPPHRPSGYPAGGYIPAPSNVGERCLRFRLRSAGSPPASVAPRPHGSGPTWRWPSRGSSNCSSSPRFPPWFWPREAGRGRGSSLPPCSGAPLRPPAPTPLTATWIGTSTRSCGAPVAARSPDTRYRTRTR